MNVVFILWIFLTPEFPSWNEETMKAIQRTVDDPTSSSSSGFLKAQISLRFMITELLFVMTNVSAID